MAGFLNKLKGAGAGNSANGSNKKKDEPPVELTPLEKMLQNAGPIRNDGSDKFFGLENFGNTCYCNSIVQALYHSVQFRDNVLKYLPSSDPTFEVAYPKPNVTTRQATNGQEASPTKAKGLTTAEAIKRRQAINAGNVAPGPGGVKPEDKPDSPEYKKKMALQKGPVLELGNDNTGSYGMQECTFTSLKDIFQVLIDSDKRTGVLSPQRLLDIFKRDNEMFRNSMHQDAHEFYGLVLNDVISTVEAHAKKVQEEEAHKPNGVNGHALASSHPNGTVAGSVRSLGAGWVHDIFEGIITSETKCLACETTSQRDETFLDLSIDLEEHSSVTSCLRNFSAEEMLCERNKFHCDTCGGLQEAEKRMKIKNLPKVLALHLKRFKYTEDYSRLQKLFHRVVYPYYLRMFDTTDDTEDPDRLYELYAVVIHIGGNAYHGHYVSVIKTQDRGWLLFDDEMVEPVDKHFVKNFFGDKPGMACAYLLLYQETTFEKAQADQEAEGYLEVDIEEDGRVSVGEAQTNGNGTTPLLKHSTQQPSSNIDDLEDPSTVSLAHAKTAPVLANGLASEPPVISTPSPLRRSDTGAKTKADKAREKKEAKEAKALEKARKEQEKASEKERQKQQVAQKRETLTRYREERRAEQADLDAAIALSLAEAKNTEVHAEPLSSPAPGGNFLNRANRGSRSMAKKSFPFLGKDKVHKEKDKHEDVTGESSSDGATPPETERRASGTHGGERMERFKERFSFSGLGRKKSTNPVAS